MASTYHTAGSLTPIVNSEGTPLKGARRARFSLHFNTPRMRRWLLVQLIVMPVEGTPDEGVDRLAFKQAHPDRLSLNSLLDRYQMESHTRRMGVV
jgi:hypothetical protein